MQIPFFDSKRIHAPYINLLSSNLLEALETGSYIQGKEVRVLEEKLAEFLNVTHCISCANGSDALTIALSSLELPKDSEVIVPSFNYVSAAESCTNLGLRVVFCDVSLINFNTTLQHIKEKVSPKTKAVVITYLFGQGIEEIDQIIAYCKENNIFIIEDNAQSFGAAIGNKKLGSFGDISTTSFFPTKNLGGIGDGGAIFTNNTNLAQKLRVLCNHGQSKKYHFETTGYNSRLDTIQAAALMVKFAHLLSDLSKRKENALQYLEELQSISAIELPTVKNHTFNQFTIKVTSRDKVSNLLKDNGITNMIYYPIPLHKQNCFAFANSDSLPNTEKLCTEVLSLPIFPRMKSDEISYICSALKEICG